MEDAVVPFIRQYIEEGYYILLNVDRGYLSFYGMGYHSNHEVMVYGYDDGKRELSCATMTQAENTGWIYDAPMRRCRKHTAIMFRSM